MRGGTTVRAVLVYVMVVLVTLIGPALVGPLFNAASGGGGAWGDLFDFFSPPAAVWESTDWMLNGERVERGGNGDRRRTWFVFVVAATYAVAGRALWATAAKRFEAEGRE